MTRETQPRSNQERSTGDFARLADRKPPGMLAEFWGLLRHNKKWWLAPIIIVSIILGVLILLFGSPVAPLIYTLF